MMGCNNSKILKGYVRVNSYGQRIMSTFTLDLTKSGKIGWEYVEIKCNLITTTTTTTSSSTTTTFTTPFPESTTSTTSTSTTTTTTTTSSTTTTTTTLAPTTTTTTTSSTTTTTTTAEPTTTTTTTTSTTTSTTTTTSSTTTTTTTAVSQFDGTFAAISMTGDAAGTTISNAEINATPFTFIPELGNNDTKGELIDDAASHTIRVYFNTSGSTNAAFVASNAIVLIQDTPGGTTVDQSTVGFTGSDFIEFTTSDLDSSNPCIVASIN